MKTTKMRWRILVSKTGGAEPHDIGVPANTEAEAISKAIVEYNRNTTGGYAQNYKVISFTN